jgi:hypothetical protein
MLLRQKTSEGSGGNLFIAFFAWAECLLREETLVTVSPCGFPLNISNYSINI